MDYVELVGLTDLSLHFVHEKAVDYLDEPEEGVTEEEYGHFLAGYKQALEEIKFLLEDAIENPPEGKNIINFAQAKKRRKAA